MKPVLSPSIHEAAIGRHLLGNDDPDAIIHGLYKGVALTREMCEKSAALTEAVMANAMESPPARHRKAREASFALIERGTRALDAAGRAAADELAALQAKTHGPPAPRDVVAEARQRELRERLAALPKDRQAALVSEAIGHGDDNLVGAVLSVPYWLAGMSKTEQDLTRASWARKRYPAELDRMTRIKAAVEDAQRAGSLSIVFVDHLTDAGIVKEAEASERAAHDALRAAKS